MEFLTFVYGKDVLFDDVRRRIALLGNDLVLDGLAFLIVDAQRVQSYRRRTDGSLAGSSQIPRFKVEYQLARSMLVRAVAEYRSNQQDNLRDDSRTNDPLLYKLDDGRFFRLSATKSNTVRPEFLFAYTPVPGTVFFAAYGSTLEDNDRYEFRNLRRQQDQLFVNVSYLLRM